MENYQIKLPPGGIEVKRNEFVEFVATSKDVTYGFAVGGSAGLIQANTGLNLIVHNTQWVIGPHAHFLLLGGLGSLLFAVIYALVPLLTKLEISNNRLVDVHFWGWILGTLGMTYAMGLAGARGMLRRTLYEGGAFEPYMLVALFFGIVMAVGFVAFLINVISTLGLKNVLSLVVPDQWLGIEPSQSQA
jgi:cytochrome c oxidase subunit 1